MRTPIGESVQNDPSILKKSLDIQLQKLIVEPYLFTISHPETISQDPTSMERRLALENYCPNVIIIDGLDECDNSKHQSLILQLLAHALSTSQLPFRFLIVSRPETHITNTFNSHILISITTRLALDETFRPGLDIAVFLRSSFEDIYNKRLEYMVNVPTPWPSDGTIDRLVQSCSGQFIYASTVVKYVD
ncbi:hypothetical protein BDQ12DRAFT_611276, partial [Crucibulum laeve]